jgi:hypothetical protein
VNSVGNARHLTKQRWERTQKQHRRGKRRHVAESVHNVGTCAVTMGSVSNANSHGERRKRRPQWHEARRYGCEWRADEKTSSYRHDRPSTRNDQKKDQPIDTTKRKTTHQERPKERPKERPSTRRNKQKRQRSHHRGQPHGRDGTADNPGQLIPRRPAHRTNHCSRPPPTYRRGRESARPAIHNGQRENSHGSRGTDNAPKCWCLQQDQCWCRQQPAQQGPPPLAYLWGRQQ